jgi:hypothetical protein
VSIVLALLAVLGGTALAAVRPNPANDHRLVNKPIEDFRYDPATHCNGGKIMPGARALAKWLDRHARGELWGIYRCEHWGPHSASLHSEGRAVDWHLDASVPKEKRAAMNLISVLRARDRYGEQFALARRMGVQGLIFNCHAWWGGDWVRYDYCYRNGHRRHHLDRTEAHMDHVHIELNKPGAHKRTSFWRSPLARE